MASSKESQRQPMNPFGMVAMPPIIQNPMMTIMAEMHGSFLESIASAQKDWMDFVHRRVFSTLLHKPICYVTCHMTRRKRIVITRMGSADDANEWHLRGCFAG